MKTLEKMVDTKELCDMCRCTEYGGCSVNTNQFNQCEGVACEETYDNYKDECEQEEKEATE